LQRSLANNRVVVSSHVDDRNGNVSCPKTVPQFDAGTIAQIDVDKDASSVCEIAVVCESRRGGKQQAGVTELPQQPRNAPQHRGIVIDDNNKVSVWQKKTAR
jgi:hypothetical protein